jgi:hypothetical protein
VKIGILFCSRMARVVVDCGEEDCSENEGQDEGRSEVKITAFDPGRFTG